MVVEFIQKIKDYKSKKHPPTFYMGPGRSPGRATGDPVFVNDKTRFMGETIL
jgi:hypothetical protein